MEIEIIKQRKEITPLIPLFPHQEVAYKISRDRRFFALFAEQGTGKSAIMIHSAAYLFYNNEIDMVLTLCPNGLQENLHYNEIPKFCSVEFQSFFISQKQGNPEYMESMLERSPGKLKWISANIDVVNNGVKYGYLEAYMKKFRTMLVIDESTIIKNTGAQRTKNVLNLAERALYRRIMTGTPSPQGPLDLYSQMRFLSKSILPFGTKTAFRNRYCVMKQMNFGMRTFQQEIGTKNMEELSMFIKPHCFRVLKKDCLQLPEKVYKNFYVELDKYTAVAYNKLKKEQMLILESGVVTASSVASCMMKLQQILSGFLYKEGGGVHTIGRNTRATQVVKYFLANKEDIFKTWEGFPRKFIFFCRFKEEIMNLKKAMKDEALANTKSILPYYKDYVEYTGDKTNEERNEAVNKFQNDPECRLMLCTSAAARGLTLTAATHVVYFSQDYNSETRSQSEDRIHRIGQTDDCTYWNVLTPNTIDIRIQAVLDKKAKFGEEVSKDWRQFFKDDPYEIDTGYEVTATEEAKEQEEE